MADEKPTATFGFRDVAAEEKPRLVGRVFSSVAGRYDMMNDLMSLGIHRIWKQAFIDWLSPSPGMQLIDVAGGTGDIAFRFLERLGAKTDGAHAAIADINEEMLAVGRDRARERAFADRITFTCADGESLPMADATFDAYTIAFGIRNFTHIDKALSEAYRVLKPGGRLLCLEFSKVDNALLASLYDLWSFNVIPAIGEAVTNDRASYQYLVESIRRFPPQKDFAAMITAAGFTRVKWRDLSGGIVAMHSGWKF